MDEVALALTRARGECVPREGSRGSPVGRRPSGIARAVRSGQLALHYLPLVDVPTGRPVGLEALVRWRHPERGTLAGSEFLEEAEASGLILSIGRWVLWQACHQVKRWEAAVAPGEVLPVHLNLSSSEFWNRELLSNLGRVTAEVGVDPAKIRLEVPESAIARRVASACRILTWLGEAGFETWLDKFGQGGVSLQDLPRLPVRHAKVGPALAWGGNGSGASEAAPLLHSLLTVGHDLGWRVAVVGVETAGQRDALGSVGCDLAEGFLFSGPLDAEGASALARQ
jgi:EAL domain-containing protein (putative c-di-GMP-specific phosphodiesterase class I)